MVCPKCGGHNVETKSYQEQHGQKDTYKSHARLHEQKHGILWWICVSWWLLPIKFACWIVCWPFMMLFRITRKKDYRYDETSTHTVTNDIRYTTLCVCHDCGKQWLLKSK